MEAPLTLASTTTKNQYQGNATTNNYSFTFYTFASTDLSVSVMVTNSNLSSYGTITALALNTDYTVSGAGNITGGSITLVSSGQAWLNAGNLSSDYAITILRNRPLTQTTDIRNQTSFYAENHEDAFDHMVMLSQQLNEILNRCIKFPVTDATSLTSQLVASSARVNSLLGFDASGNVTITPTGGPFSGFTQGSVLFAGAGGTLTQNNASLFWDNAAVSLCIGVNHATSSSGNFCVASGFSMRARNALNTLDLQILKCEASDGISIGSTATVGDIAIVTGSTADITFQPGGIIACAGNMDASGTHDLGVNNPFRNVYAGTSFISGPAGSTTLTGRYYCFSAAAGAFYISRDTTNSIEGFWGVVNATDGTLFGSSTNHPVTFRQNNANAWSISTAKALLPVSTYDIAASGARCGTGYFTTLNGTNLTVTGLTQNSILFCGASGVISQDTTNLLFSTSGSAKLTAGTAFLGAWQASTTWCFLQNSALAANVAGNYALIQSSTGQTVLNAASGQNFNFRVNNADVVIGAATSFQIQSGVSIGFFGHSVAAQGTRGATFTNNITSGGTTDSPANWTDLTTYATDAAAIRNFCYQMARAMNQHDVALRAYGLLT